MSNTLNQSAHSVNQQSFLERSPHSIHHSFDIHLAETYGIEEAILIHHFQHWISINTRLNRNFYEGCYWTYQTIDEIVAHFPYMTKERVVNVIDRLCEGKSRFSKKDGKDFEPVLKRGNFNKSKYDRTTWYAFCVPTKWILCKHKMEIGEPQNGNWENTIPIPDSIPDPKPSLSLEKKETKKEAPAPLLSFGLFVRLKKEEYGKLCEDHGKEVIDQKIEAMNDYISTHGKKPYKDYAAAIRTWLRRDKTIALPNSSAPHNLDVEKNRKLLSEILVYLDMKGGWSPIFVKGNLVYHSTTRDSISVLTSTYPAFKNTLQAWTKLKIED